MIENLRHLKWNIVSCRQAASIINVGKAAPSERIYHKHLKRWPNDTFLYLGPDNDDICHGLPLPYPKRSCKALFVLPDPNQQPEPPFLSGSPYPPAWMQLSLTFEQTAEQWQGKATPETYLVSFDNMSKGDTCLCVVFYENRVTTVDKMMC